MHSSDIQKSPTSDSLVLGGAQRAIFRICPANLYLLSACGGSCSSSPSAFEKKKKEAWLVATDWLWLFLIFGGQMPVLAAAAIASVLSSVLFIMFMRFTSGKQPNIWTCSYIIQRMKALAVPAFNTFISKRAWRSLFGFFKRRRRRHRRTRLYFQTFFPALKPKLVLL